MCVDMDVDALGDQCVRLFGKVGPRVCVYISRCPGGGVSVHVRAGVACLCLDVLVYGICACVHTEAWSYEVCASVGKCGVCVGKHVVNIHNAHVSMRVSVSVMRGWKSM